MCRWHLARFRSYFSIFHKYFINCFFPSSSNLLQFFSRLLCSAAAVWMNFPSIFPHIHLSRPHTSLFTSAHPPFIFSQLLLALVHTAHLSNKCAWCPHIFLSLRIEHIHTAENGVAKIQSKWSSHIFDWTHISFYWIFVRPLHPSRSALSFFIHIFLPSRIEH